MTTIIELQPGKFQGDVDARIEDTTTNVARPWRPESLPAPIVVPENAGAPWVRERGLALRKLFGPLGQVSNALTSAFAQQGVHPIYLRTVAEEAEVMDWEMLYDDGRGEFLSLTDTWPIGRLTANKSNSGRPPEPFPAALRVMAVLSASGPESDAVPDWTHLSKAAARFAAKGLNIDLRVYTGQPELEQAVTAAGGALHPVPEKPDELAAEIRDFNPHVLHFYCHGSASAGAPFLEIATSNDFREGNKQGSLILPDNHLRGALAGSAIWLLVLNCCSGAEAAGSPSMGDSRSLARKVAEEANVPAAIGMATAVSPADAAEFTRSFYPGLFEYARKRLVAHDESFIDWATMLVPVRRALSLGKDPAEIRTWAMPIVYALAPTFCPAFTAASAFVLRPAHLAVLERAAQAIRIFTLPDEVKRQALAVMLADIPKEFWPGIDGQFSSVAIQP